MHLLIFIHLCFCFMLFSVLFTPKVFLMFMYLTFHIYKDLWDVSP